MDWIVPYNPSILALGAFGGLQLLQLLVADAVSILRKHPPGHPPPGDHDDFHFRSIRAYANSVETTGVYLLVSAFAILRQADPDSVNLWSLVFVGARAAHMLCYWLDLRIARSIAFTIGVIALVALLVIGF